MPRVAAFCLLAVFAAACAREQWPDPPPADRAAYEREYQAWRDEQREMLRSVLPIVGIWPLPEGQKDAEAAARGTVELVEVSGSDGRPFLMAVDASHPAAADPPQVEAFPLDERWRLSARFDAFDRPRPVRVPDVRGGAVDLTAVGELVFPLDGDEHRLTAFGEEGRDEFFVMFKDATNQSTTYAGYRIVSPKAVKSGEWTVLDFNFAMNPPCAYSKYTTCPLPPPENRLPVAVEAGLKRLPSADGFVPAS